MKKVRGYFHNGCAPPMITHIFFEKKIKREPDAVIELHTSQHTVTSLYNSSLFDNHFHHHKNHSLRLARCIQ